MRISIFSTTKAKIFHHDKEHYPIVKFATTKQELAKGEIRSVRNRLNKFPDFGEGNYFLLEYDAGLKFKQRAVVFFNKDASQAFLSRQTNHLVQNNAEITKSKCRSGFVYNIYESKTGIVPCSDDVLVQQREDALKEIEIANAKRIQANNKARTAQNMLDNICSANNINNPNNVSADLDSMLNGENKTDTDKTEISVLKEKIKALEEEIIEYQLKESQPAKSQLVNCIKNIVKEEKLTKNDFIELIELIKDKAIESSFEAPVELPEASEVKDDVSIIEQGKTPLDAPDETETVDVQDIKVLKVGDIFKNGKIIAYFMSARSIDNFEEFCSMSMAPSFSHFVSINKFIIDDGEKQKLFDIQNNITTLI